MRYVRKRVSWWGSISVLPAYTWFHEDVIKYGNISRVTGPLCGEFTDPRWIPREKASDAELCGILWSAPEAGDLRRHRAHYHVIVMRSELVENIITATGIWHHTGIQFHDDAIRLKHFPRYWPFRGEFTGWWIETPSWSLWRHCNVTNFIKSRIK